MKVFFAIVHTDEEGAFGVSFPDLPGCFSAADRIEDVLPNAMGALALWFEDADEIEPSEANVILQKAKADLADGAFLIAVPLTGDGVPEDFSKWIICGEVALRTAPPAGRQRGAGHGCPQPTRQIQMHSLVRAVALQGSDYSPASGLRVVEKISARLCGY